MVQKTISLPEPLYERLKARKKPDETFPDLIDRLLGASESTEKTPISSFFGQLHESDPDEWDTIEKDIYESRLNAKESSNVEFGDE
jgi:predicted CopG family antitoxin